MLKAHLLLNSQLSWQEQGRFVPTQAAFVQRCEGVLLRPAIHLARACFCLEQSEQVCTGLGLTMKFPPLNPSQRYVTCLSANFLPYCLFVDLSLALKHTGMKKQHGNDELRGVKWHAVCKSFSVKVLHNPLKAAWREQAPYKCVTTPHYIF